MRELKFGWHMHSFPVDGSSGPVFVDQIHQTLRRIHPHVDSVWVDDRDKVWLTEWSSNAIVRFDPVAEKFDSFPSSRSGADVRQMLGRVGEAWGAESGNARLVMVPAQ